MVKQESMWSGLALDSYGINISFSKSKSEIIFFLKEKSIMNEMPTETQIIIKSKLLSLDTAFSISFLFQGEKLISITASPDWQLKGNALYFRYNQIQRKLEKELGHPHSCLRRIMNLLDSDNRSARWQRNGVKIEHSLLERFGTEEAIRIELP